MQLVLSKYQQHIAGCSKSVHQWPTSSGFLASSCKCVEPKKQSPLLYGFGGLYYFFETLFLYLCVKKKKEDETEQ